MVINNWFDKAKCKEQNIPTDKFFPDRGGTLEVKYICQNCPVAKPCLEYSFRNSSKFGIWGGLSENQRRKIRSIKWKQQERSNKQMTLSEILKLMGVEMSRLDDEELIPFSGEGFYR
tara:strand:- start:2601 stop:2951 length:351 start_codon:yes stop_codon:yes gene_type:complete